MDTLLGMKSCDVQETSVPPHLKIETGAVRMCMRPHDRVSVSTHPFFKPRQAAEKSREFQSAKVQKYQ